MAQIATTIEQSKKLIELGLSADTADMFYYKENIFNNALSVFNGQLLVRGNSELKDEDTIPAWSLSRLLELMPLPLLTQHINNRWYMVIYPNGKHISLDEYDNPIDAAFEMMCYLLKNKLIK